MKKQKKYLHIIVFAAIYMVFMFRGTQASAVTERYSNYIAGTSVYTGATFQVSDPKFGFISSTQYTDLTIRNFIKFTFERDSTYFADSFNVWVALHLTGVDAGNNAVSLDTTLHISFHPDSAYTDVQLFAFSGWEEVNVEVTDLYSDVTSWLPPNLFLEAEIEVERIYGFPCDSLMNEAGLSVNYLAVSHEIEITWPVVRGAEEYDLEWAYIDDLDKDAAGNITTIPASALKWNFKGHATRITTAANSYRVTLVFPRGYVLFRVRPVGRGGSQPLQRIEGPWSSDNFVAGSALSSYGNKFHVTAAYELDAGLNWRYEAVYAEGGKKKEIISYFDGSLRSRQMQTRLNTSYDVLVQEDIYDYYGRKAISVFPVPAGDSILFYRAGFNRDASGNDYTAADFDVHSSTCASPAAATMSTSYGASLYYSSNNPVKSVYNAYIPEAGGYPFTRVEYMPDNTGRVKKQGAAGPQHQINGEHATEMYYAAPGQTELDRLFGTEVGYASHYKKVSTKDANGQISVAYKDMDGRVIATALAGRVPGNMDSIPYTPTQITEDLLEKNIKSDRDGTLKLNEKFLVTSTGQYSFTYDLTGASYSPECKPENFCFDCVYDLEISIKNSCGEQMIPGGAVSQRVGEILPEEQACGSAAAFSLGSGGQPLEIVLEPGVYDLVKTLKVNEAAVDSYAVRYAEYNTCKKTLQDFIDEAKAKLDYSGCNASCPTCNTEATACSVAYEMMLVDVSPGGQYARDTSIGEDREPNKYRDQYNFLLVNGNSLGTDKDYKHPDPAYSPLINIDGNDIDPASLDSLDFIRYWKAEWAHSLVKYHPEYCKYDWCLNNHASDTFDQWMARVETYAEAKAAGVMDDPLLVDPFFASGGGQPYKPGMASKMLNYKWVRDSMTLQIKFLSMWQMATVMAACPTEVSDSNPYGCLTGPDTTGYYDDPCLQDKIWTIFKGLYLGQKRKFYENARNALSCGPVGGRLTRFTDLKDDFGFDPYGDPQTVYNEALDKLGGQGDRCQKQCVAYVPQWWRKLKGCNISAADSADIITEMIKICRKGCDPSHLLGSSTVPADSPGVYRNFDDVLKWKLGANYKSLICDASLIDLPPPYNANTQGGNGTFAELDACGCDKVLYAQMVFDTSSVLPVGVTSASGMLQYLYGEALIDFKGVSCKCTQAFGLGGNEWSFGAGWADTSKLFLDSLDIYIPNSLSCKECLNCRKVQDSIKSFRRQYTHLVGTSRYNTALATTLNGWFGFNLTYHDYLEFDGHCNLQPGNDNISCQALSPQASPLSGLISQLAAADLLDSSGIHPLSSGMLPPSLYSLASGQRDSCYPVYRFVDLRGDTLTAEISDSCGFQCNIELIKPSSVASFAQLSINTSAGILPDPGQYHETRHFILFTNAGDTVRGHTTCYNINVCSDTPADTNEVCGYNSRLLDTCGCNRLLEVSNIVVNDSAIARTDPSFMPVFSQVFYQRYGYIFPDLTPGATLCMSYLHNGVIENNGTEYQYANKVYGNIPWQQADLEALDATNIQVPRELGCATCYDCEVIEQAVLEFDQLSGSNTDSLELYYMLLSKHLQAGWGVNFKAYPTFDTLYAANGSCTECAGRIVTVCDSVNNTGRALQHFLDSLSRNGDLLATALPLFNPYYDVFTKSELYNDHSCARPFYNAVLSGDSLVMNLTDELGFNCSIVLKGECGHYGEIDSIKAIEVDVKGKGTQYGFRLTAYINGEAVELTGYSGCYPVSACCVVNTSRLCNKPLVPKLIVNTDRCEGALNEMAEYQGRQRYEEYIEELKEDFRAGYKAHCLSSLQETIKLQYNNDMHHFTLYYYDQAGNLVKTVPPQGVQPFTASNDLATVKSSRIASSDFRPVHAFVSRYKYNTLNELVESEMPDHDGITYLWYDRLGRIVLKQDARQQPQDLYSYTLYDNLGRLVEAGEIENATAVSTAFARNDANLASFISGGTRRQSTRTLYDETALPGEGIIAFGHAQENLRNRIASALYYEERSGDYTFASHYSYDAHGNVTDMVQEVPELYRLQYNYFHISYAYDLVSSKVNRVNYQQGKADQFFQRYEYDADNRLTDAYTSRDEVIWDHDARYRYYRHGPAARVELGEYSVQGMDYAYTINGWIKGMNSDMLIESDDMGKDGNAGGANWVFGRDAAGFTLNFFDNDYTHIAASGTTRFEAAYLGSGINAASPGLYNGNIRRMVTAIGQFMQGGGTPLGAAFRYDQLNRLAGVETFSNMAVSAGSSAWQSGGGGNAYKETFSYDANGNITNLNRYDGSGTQFDQFAYNYSGTDNRLLWVDDGIGTGVAAKDVDDQASGNYVYDGIGNLIHDEAEEIDNIEWGVSGKVREISRSSGSSRPGLRFRYDAMGQRILKIVMPDDTVTHWTYTYYVRDAQGNVMATYQRAIEKVSSYYEDTLKLAELDIYGASRLGVVNVQMTVSSATYTGTEVQGVGITLGGSLSAYPVLPDDGLLSRQLASKAYEITNHLGNVLVTVSDRKNAVDDNADGITDWYTADILTAQDYYAFGSLKEDRTYEKPDSKGYRYGFNGKEKDDEVKGDGNSYDFGDRLCDSRVARWLSIDPYASDYPYSSPYISMANNPIAFIDINGDSTYLIIHGAGYLNTDMQGEAHDVGDGFKINAEKLAEKIKNRKGFNSNRDKVVVVYAPSTEKFVKATNKKYSSGKIASLTVFSHGYQGGISLGGEEGNSTQKDEYDLREINSVTITKIDGDNFEDNATATLNGCNIGKGGKSSFAQTMANYLDIAVKAFDNYSEFKSKKGNGRNVIYDGEMIRSVDRKNQKAKYTIFKKGKDPLSPK